MRKLYIFSLIGLAAIIIGLAWAEQITLSTYYPAPYGVYRDFKVTRNATFATETDPATGELVGMVGIGTTTPGAKLDVSSTTSGFLPPRMTTLERDEISNPPTGSVIYNTDSGEQGLNHYNGTGWEAVGGEGFGNYGTVITLTAPVLTTETNEVAVTQAATNLLVFATCVSNGNTNWVLAVFKGYTGTTANPNTLRAMASIEDDHGPTSYGLIANSFVMFVKKGEYYRITGQSNGWNGATRTYCTIPVGN